MAQIFLIFTLYFNYRGFYPESKLRAALTATLIIFLFRFSLGRLKIPFGKLGPAEKKRKYQLSCFVAEKKAEKQKDLEEEKDREIALKTASMRVGVKRTEKGQGRMTGLAKEQGSGKILEFLNSKGSKEKTIELRAAPESRKTQETEEPRFTQAERDWFLKQYFGEFYSFP